MKTLKEIGFLQTGMTLVEYKEMKAQLQELRI